MAMLREAGPLSLHNQDLWLWVPAPRAQLRTRPGRQKWCHPAPTAVLRQARCTAQVQPGGCDASCLFASAAALSLAGMPDEGARAGIASFIARAAVDRSGAGMLFRIGASQRSTS